MASSKNTKEKKSYKLAINNKTCIVMLCITLIISLFTGYILSALQTLTADVAMSKIFPVISGVCFLTYSIYGTFVIVLYETYRDK